MNDRELMQQALDALEKMKAHSYLRLDYAEEAIAALRERLAQPVQEPIEESSFTHSHLWIGELWRKEKNT